VKNLERTAEKARSLEVRPRVYFEEWDDPMICGIQWVSELIEIAGGVDVFGDRAHGKLAVERQVTASDVTKAAPDLMLASWCGKAFDLEAVQARDEMQTTPAVRSGRIAEIPADIILQPGPACLTDGLRSVAAHIEATAAAMTESPAS
jgi:iron complex transport system substrate-binding protein